MSKRRKKSDLLREQETPMVLGHELVRHSLTPRIRAVSPAQEPVAAARPVLPAVSSFVDPAPAFPMFSDLLALSSGTLARLAGSSDYATIDAYHTRLVQYYCEQYSSAWESWIDVVAEYETCWRSSQ